MEHKIRSKLFNRRRNQFQDERNQDTIVVIYFIFDVLHLVNDTFQPFYKAEQL